MAQPPMEVSMLMAVAIITIGMAMLTAPSASELIPLPTKIPSIMVNRKMQAFDRIAGMTYFISVRVRLVCIDTSMAVFFYAKSPAIAFCNNRAHPTSSIDRTINKV